MAMHNQGQMKKSGKRHHPIRWILLIILLLVLLGGAYCGLTFYKEAKQVQAHEQKAISALQSVASQGNVANLINAQGDEDLEKLDSSISTAQSETKAAQTIAHGRLWAFASRIPFLRNDIVNVQGLTDIAHNLAADSLPQFTGIVQGLRGASFSSGNGELNLAPIMATGAKLTSVNASLQTQVAALNKLPQPRIPQIKKANQKASKAILGLSGKINTVTGLTNSLPSLLGVNEARSYLVIAQTSSEARSGGGLVGSVGTLKADKGVITIGAFHANSEFKNWGTVSNLVTPAQCQALVCDGYPWYGHYINDVSVNPNFPDTAALVKQMWNYQGFGDTTADGVISLDPVALQKIIRVTGNVTMGNGKVLTGQDTAQYLLNQVYIDVPVAYQNAYFESVVSQVTKNAFSHMTAKKMLQLADVMTESAQWRHLYVWSFHKEDLSALRQAGVTGEVNQESTVNATGIYNEEMIPSKMDWYIRRTTTIKKTGSDPQGATYHVTSVVRNTLSPSVAPTLPKYITLHFDGQSRLRMYIYPPKGGHLSNVRFSNGTTLKSFPLDGRTIYRADPSTLMPGQSVTIDYDVTCAPGSSKLVLDQSPMGIEDPQVTYQY